VEKARTNFHKQIKRAEKNGARTISSTARAGDLKEKKKGYTPFFLPNIRDREENSLSEQGPKKNKKGKQGSAKTQMNHLKRSRVDRTPWAYRRKGATLYPITDEKKRKTALQLSVRRQQDRRHGLKKKKARTSRAQQRNYLPFHCPARPKKGRGKKRDIYWRGIGSCFAGGN